MAEKRFKASIIIGGIVDGSLVSATGSVSRAMRQVGDAIKLATERQKKFAEQIEGLKALGLNVTGFERRQARLTSQINQTTAAQERLNRAQQRSERLRQHASALRGAASRAGAGAAAGGLIIGAALHAGSEMQTETTRLKLLGASGKDKLQAIEFGRALRNFGTSQTQNVEMMRDALAVFGHLGEAKSVTPLMGKMMFANRALYGTGQEQAEAQFQDMMRVIDVRGGTNSPAQYRDQADHIQRAITASGNRVTATDWREVVQRGGLAAKGFSNDALYYQMLPLVQEMGGSQVGTAMASAYQNLYQGKTTRRAAKNLDQLGLIGDTSKVTYDKSGQTAQLNPGALLGADVFRRSQFDWVQKVLLPQLAKKGITDQKQITDTIGSIVSNRTGANLLATMVLQGKVINRDANLAANAAGIDEANRAARGTSAGQTRALGANYADLKLNFGEAITPAFVAILGKVNAGLSRLNQFMHGHPKLARAMAVGAVAVTGAMAASVPVLIAAGLALNTYAGFALLAAKRTALLSAAQIEETTVSKAATMGFLTRINPLKAAGSVFGLLGTAIRAVGVALLGVSAPAAAVAVAFGAAAYLIWRYWEPIKAFFTGFVAGLQEAFAPLMPLFHAVFDPVARVVGRAWSWLMKLLAPVHETRQGLADMTEAGANFGRVVGGAIAGVIGLCLKFEERLMGVYNWLYKLAGTGFGKAKDWLTGASATPIPALSGGGNVASAQQSTHHHTYHITQQPGQSSEALARQIADIHMKRRGGVSLSDGAD